MSEHSPLSHKDPEQVTGNVTISLYTLLLNLYQMTQSVVTYSEGEDGFGRDIVTDIVTSLKPSTWLILKYFFKHGASSAWILRYKLQVHRREVYRSLETLRSNNLIQIKTTMRPTPKRKRSAIIWGSPDCTEAQVVEATKLYKRLTNPIYLRAESMGFAFLDQAMSLKPSSIYRKELMDFLIEKKIKGHERKDMADMMTIYLKEQGFTVWS